MQGAEFQIEDEDGGVGLGADGVAGDFEGVHGGVAAHEADGGALDGGAEAEVVDDFEVEAGGVEAGAGGDDDVRDGVAFLGGDGEAIEGAASERGGGLLVDFHAVGGGRKAAALVEFAAVEGGGVVGVGGVEREDGVAVIDAGAGGDAAEEQGGALVFDELCAEVDEGLVDVMGGDGGADAIEIGRGAGGMGGASWPVLHF